MKNDNNKPRRVPLTDRQRIRRYILRYYAVLKVGQQFHGSTLAEYCLEKAGTPEKYKPTVLQYMNQMKREGLLNYRCIRKDLSLYEKLA